MVIDWEKDKIHIKAPHIQHLLRIIKEQKDAFETISFTRVYRDLNTEGNTLSKEALAIHQGLMEVRKIKNELIENHLVCL